MKSLGAQGDPDDPFDQEDSVLSEQNNFDLHNKIYELTSRCNSLEYDRTKIISEYEIALRELKHKNTILQRLCSEKQEREEKLNLVVFQLRGKMQGLEEENDIMAKDLNSMLEKNRVTPNFNSPELYHDSEILSDLLQKEEKIQKLESQLEQMKRNDEKAGRLEKESFQRERQHFKEQLMGLQQSKQALQLALRQAEDKISDLQQKIRHLQSQKKKIFSKYDKNEEQSKFLEQQRKHHQKQKKTLQQEIYRLTSELSQVRAASFNDKLDFKKQLNVIRSEYEEEKMKNRGQYQDKISQNKRLKESLYTLGQENDQLRGFSNQNQQLRVKVEQLKILCEKGKRQNEHLSQQNQRLIREGSKWQQFADESIKRGRDTEYQMVLRQLEQQVQSKSMELKESARKMRQWQSKAQQFKLQLQNQNELIQILKIQKKQHDSKLKQQVKRREEIQSQKAEKEKVISHLQSQIRALKDDNRQLELANDQLSQKVQTLKLINSDIENIKQQLQLQKQYYHQMRRQEEHLRKAHKQPSHHEQALLKEVESLKERNQQLQYRISEIESESGRRAIDLKLQEEENKRLREVANSPRTMDLQPLVQHSKRTQFNAVFLQNKILQLQKEITGLKNIKEKEFEEYKKVYAKRMTEKYQLQMQKNQGYLRQLQKNNELLSQKLSRYELQSKEVVGKMNLLMKENYEAKVDYSQTLQELNLLLQRYKALEDSHREIQNRNNKYSKSAEDTQRFKSHLQKATKINEQLAYRLRQANDQIAKLNEVLMRKQGELKSMRSNSSINTSFVSQQQTKNNPNIPVRMRSQHEHSSDGDSLRSWVKKSPNFSRI